MLTRYTQTSMPSRHQPSRCTESVYLPSLLVLLQTCQQILEGDTPALSAWDYDLEGEYTSLTDDGDSVTVGIGPINVTVASAESLQQLEADFVSSLVL